jgi:hypothetical protein
MGLLGLGEVVQEGLENNWRSDSAKRARCRSISYLEIEAKSVQS